MILQKLVMRVPNSDGILAPSRLLPPVFVNRSDFLRLADNARVVMVSLEKDGISNPHRITAYGDYIEQQPFALWQIEEIVNGRHP